MKMLCTGCSIKEANHYFYSGSSLNLEISFRQGILRQIKQCLIKINKHDSKHLILSKYYLYGVPQIKNFNKSVLDTKFVKWQIKIRKHDLGHYTLKLKCTEWVMREVISLLS